MLMVRHDWDSMQMAVIGVFLSDSSCSHYKTCENHAPCERGMAGGHSSFETMGLPKQSAGSSFSPTQITFFSQ